MIIDFSVCFEMFLSIEVSVETEIFCLSFVATRVLGDSTDAHPRRLETCSSVLIQLQQEQLFEQQRHQTELRHLQEEQIRQQRRYQDEQVTNIFLCYNGT